jgi:hypothetical protein
VLISYQSRATGMVAEDGSDDSGSITTSRPACATNLYSQSPRFGMNPCATLEAQVVVDAHESSYIIPASECPNLTPSGQTNGRLQALEKKRVTSKAEGVCLIVSLDPLKQLMFSRSVVRHGWRTVVCSDPVAVASHLASGNVELALVDLGAGHLDEAVDSCRNSIALLSRLPKLLTIVCGQTRNANEEIWARSNGVWVYLPGVPPEADLDDILSGAKHVLLDRLKQ